MVKFSLGWLFLDCVVCTTMQCVVLEVAAGVTCMVSQERLKAFCFVCVLFSFVFVFIFIDLNMQDCNRRCLKKDLFHFVIFMSVLKVPPFVSDELWDNLSSCF